MDKEVCNWILHFLLKPQPNPLQIPTHTHLLSLLLPLSLSSSSHTLLKSILLRTINPSSSSSLLSLKTVSLLEHIEELDHQADVTVSPSLRHAYCQVAVGLTVSVIDDVAEYFEVLKRVWRGRVGKMGDCGLVSEELVMWRDELEAAVWDKGAGERVRERWKREEEAVKAVRKYLVEAWEGLGTTFLDDVTGEEGVVREVLRLEKREGGYGNDEICENGVVPDKATLNTDMDMSGIRNNGVLNEKLIINNENNVSTNETEIPRRTRVAKIRTRGTVAGTSRGAKITDTEQVENEELSNKYNFMPTPAISRVQEALKSSTMELHAVVTDPLPEALEFAKKAISTNNRDSSAEDVANEADLKRPSTSHENIVPKLSLMTRNKSAHTYEVVVKFINSRGITSVPFDHITTFVEDAIQWDSSIDDLPEGSTGSVSRIKLPSPKYLVVSPLRIHQNANVRRKKMKWSMLEEATLRAGVEKYGIGRWKAILNSYRDVFENRTDVDLKDKWRNMTRYAP